MIADTDLSGAGRRVGWKHMVCLPADSGATAQLTSPDPRVSERELSGHPPRPRGMLMRREM